MERAAFEPADSRTVSDIGECAVAIVVIQNVFSILRDKKIGKSVIVVIAPDATEPETAAGNTGLFRDIRERSVAIVAVERVANQDAAAVAVTSIHKVEVRPAIAVEIGHANARAELFEIDGDSLVSLVVGELNGGFGGDILKTGGRGSLRVYQGGVTGKQRRAERQTDCNRTCSQLCSQE